MKQEFMIVNQIASAKSDAGSCKQDGASGREYNDMYHTAKYCIEFLFLCTGVAAFMHEEREENSKYGRD